MGTPEFGSKPTPFVGVRHALLKSPVGEGF